MKQILQNMKSGELLVEDVAAAAVKPGHLLIQTSRSLISAGTERMLVEFGRAGYLAKAKQQPEKVKQVLDKVRTDGLIATARTVMARLDQPMPLGYSNVGRVLEVGEGVSGFRPGDRVVSNGRHAEIALVAKHLCAKIPEGVDDDRACFTVVGSIGLQGVRLINPTLGESIAVFGLGLIGLLAVQILKAHGARVIGFDFDPERVELAKEFNVEAENLALGIDPVQAALAFTAERGVDGVLVTAATKSDELMHQAAEMCRKRGRIVLTGVTGLNLRRADFYEKELTFQVSCSYGPGRYDPFYEQQGNDYPMGFVRWTEQRNFEAVLELLREGRLAVDSLISKRVPLSDAKRAYDAVAAKSVIGVLLEYPQAQTKEARETLTANVVSHRQPQQRSQSVVCGVIGAGNFAQLRMLPGLAKAGARLKWVASSTGLSGSTAARRFGIENSTTEVGRIFADPEVNAVLIATRHDTHAPLVLQGLQAGKSVFVEKPLCLTGTELESIIGGHRQAERETDSRAPLLMVGYNRRFAPLVSLLRSRLAGRKRPLAMTFTCNAGAIPGEHWVHDPKAGGGRILGEACHFIDLLHFLTDESPITRVAALKHGSDESNLEDTVAISLTFADGSLGQVNYFANGAKSYPKERLEVFSEGSVFLLDNFRRLTTHGKGAGKGKRTLTQNKGHAIGFRHFVEAVSCGAESPVSFESLVNTTSAALAAVEAIREHRVIEVPPMPLATRWPDEQPLADAG